MGEGSYTVQPGSKAVSVSADTSLLKSTKGWLFGWCRLAAFGDKKRWGTLTQPHNVTSVTSQQAIGTNTPPEPCRGLDRRSLDCLDNCVAQWQVRDDAHHAEH